jgi:ATP-dependent protease ClpP protease subunit
VTLFTSLLILFSFGNSFAFDTPFALDIPTESTDIYIDPITSTKTIHFFKTFESKNSHGISDVDFFKQAIGQLQLSEGDTLLVQLKSFGGEISVGLNIHAFLLWLQSKGVNVVTQVPADGYCYSICIPVFAAGSQRMADKSAEFIFHPPFFPNIKDANELMSAVELAKNNYLSAIQQADPEFAKFIEQEKWIQKGQTTKTADEIEDLFPDFLELLPEK